MPGLLSLFWPIHLCYVICCMGRRFYLLMLSVLLSSCANYLHTGLHTITQLEGEGDIQLAGHATLQDVKLGGHAQIAYAFNDAWGGLASVGYSAGRYGAITDPPDENRAVEIGMVRMFGQAKDPSPTRYYVQGGYVFTNSSILQEIRPGLRYSQHSLYVQASSRHQLHEYLAVVFALRGAGSNVRWVGPNQIPTNTFFDQNRVEAARNYLNFQPIFWMVTPMIQAEISFGQWSLMGILQPTLVLNQRYLTLPSGPLNLGVRWNFKK